MAVGDLILSEAGGRTIVEVGIATSIGVRAPGVAWCSDAFLASHPEDMPLSGAPEICVEITSASNSMPQLREKATAYLDAGAVETWILVPELRRCEIYGRSGRLDETAFAVIIEALFD